MPETIDLSICGDCLQMLANAEPSPDRPADQPEPLALVSGDDIALGGEELGFSTSPCEGCGDRHHGDRFTATEFVRAA